MAVQLYSSYLRRSFQLLAKLTPKTISNDEAFDRASNILYLWTKYKFSNVFRHLPQNKNSFDDKRDGNEVGIIFDPHNSQFIMRCVHPDISVPGRLWTTDAELTKYNGCFLFAVRLSVTSLHSCTEEVPFSCPEFVRNVINNIGISDVIPVGNQPHLLNTKEDVDSFVSFIENSNRRFPVVLLTPCFNIEEGTYSGYMMNASQMAHDLLGISHIFQISSDVNEYLTERIGRQWSAFNGSVRTYYPNISYNESDCYQHPMLTQRSIRLRDSIECVDSDLCMHEIEKYIENYVLSQQIAWEDSNVEFYLPAYQNYLRKQRAANVQSRQELIDSYEGQLNKLQKQCDENLALADSYAKDYEAYRDETDKQCQKINHLKAQITAFRFQIKEATGKSIDQDVPTDGDYSDVGKWIDTYFTDRLVLLPRAARSLKNAVYEDKELVYKCLILLATKYFDYCTGVINYEEFYSACKSLDPGLEERCAITDISAGMQDDEYFVQYHNHRQKLERHLAKGSSKDQRYCLRIYFFWDDKEQTIVIGDMPHHLDTSAT